MKRYRASKRAGIGWVILNRESQPVNTAIYKNRDAARKAAAKLEEKDANPQTV